jgi:uncharacterized beta-barrel protein YwiB (DUF1934 family)
MKNIRLKITGAHVYEQMEENQLELVTEGKMYTRGKTIYLTYDESEFSGMEGCKTRLCIDGDIVRMTRRGSGVGVDTEIHFEKGKRYSGFYDTPYGPVEMEVLTNDLSNNVSQTGGALSIDYNISLKGLSEGRSRLDIVVTEA